MGFFWGTSEGENDFFFFVVILLREDDCTARSHSSSTSGMPNAFADRIGDQTAINPPFPLIGLNCQSRGVEEDPARGGKNQFLFLFPAVFRPSFPPSLSRPVTNGLPREQFVCLPSLLPESVVTVGQRGV